MKNRSHLSTFAYIVPIISILLVVFCSWLLKAPSWQSHFITWTSNNTLSYTADAQGNILPDFSKVGYRQGNQSLPVIPVVKTIAPNGTGDQQPLIQAAIDEVSQRMPDANGFRGALLLQKGNYPIAGTLHIRTGGIVLRGEGDQEKDTRLIATGKGQRSLLEISGSGSLQEKTGTRVSITDTYVPAGAISFTVASAKGLQPGDNIVVFRPGTQQWLHDLHMDSIVPKSDTRQWTPKEYDFRFERVITRVEGNRLFIDQPVVMAMETKYGGGEVFKYDFNGRLSNIGIEHLYFESAYTSDTAEDHGWTAVKINKAENCWVQHITSRYFGYSCVHLGGDAKYVTIAGCHCLDAKSQITGGRRYSFNNDGQMNLFTDCHTTEGRHDYVTGAQVRGPNVFFNCTAKRTHADIGPHHRWSMGTLYDNIITDGEINIQDRGNWGTGHGWAGVNQVVWHCTADKATVQQPWVSGTNYCIGLQGQKVAGRFKERQDGQWEGLNQEGLIPSSLYMAQLKARKNKQ
jgi:hypothetical protein